MYQQQRFSSIHSLINTAYYTLKPIIPRKLQILCRRVLAQRKRKKHRSVWPIDPDSATTPINWGGWPDGRKFALVLSHDVDTQIGHDRVFELLSVEKRLGFKSSFNFVPERYRLSRKLIEAVKKEGFEVNVHGLKHDGKLFQSKKIFSERAKKINSYLKEWGSEGFTAPSMICNLDWIHDLKIKHSTCTFDTDPFEPLPKPSGTIFPFFVPNSKSANTIVELPYTLPQDHALFIILQESKLTIWKEKLDWIVKNGGMALLNTHPDYMGLGDAPLNSEEYPIGWYKAFLTHVRDAYHGQFWHALPSEVARFWETREMLQTNFMS